jgi:cellobiose epimerase
MIRRRSYSGLTILLSVIFPVLMAFSSDGSESKRLAEGKHWLRQGLQNIIPFWYANVPDTVNGAYYLNLSREGAPLPPFDKYPPMISRQVFGFTAAYLMSGDEKYLESARSGADYLMTHAWDKEYGGWYDMLDKFGNPSLTTKSVPNQLYSDAGLALYYFATGDEEALKLVMSSVEIHHKKAFDPHYGGFYQVLTRELGVADSSKSKHSHYGYTSSLLINLYIITRDPGVLRFADELMRVSFLHLRDNADGWFGGFPAPCRRNWEPAAIAAGNEPKVSAGGQLTAVLSLLRMYELTGDTVYRNYGLTLFPEVKKAAYDNSGGFWLDTFTRPVPHTVSDTTVMWWLQSYGMMSELHTYRLTGNPACLKDYKAMADFWDKYFLDHRYGGVFQSVTKGGEPVVSSKAMAWKTSYHEMENALLNYLYLSLYVNDKTAGLYFHIRNTSAGKKHFVSLAEGKDVVIRSVTINGHRWNDFDSDERSVSLPVGDLKIKVVLGRNSNPF